MARATVNTATNENDVRLTLFNPFMTCPHRDTEKIREIHETVRTRDPSFYAHLACWYRKSAGEVLRDHNELFTALLATDPYVDNREVGLALFREHAPWMKNRVVGFIKGKVAKIRVKTGNMIKRGKKNIPEVKIEEKKVGLNKSLPTSLKTEIANYLAYLEANKDRFDAVAMRNFRDLKDLYFARGKHAFKHNDRVQKILFEKEFPADSKLAVFKKIANAKTPEEAAKLIVENKIPYTTAVGLVSKITPSVLVALINSMSSQELINNIASLKERGAMDNEDTKKLIETKLNKAKTAKNVSALKSKTATGTGRVKDEAIEKQLDAIADVQIKRGGTIKVPTAVLVDRSGSMNEAIEIGKRVSAMISGVTESNLYVVAFDSAPMGIVSEGKTLSDWEKAFKPVRPGGNTSMGCALEYLLKKKQLVEQIVVVTDEGENAHPMFTEVFDRYKAEMGVVPHVVIIHVGSMGTTFRDNLDAAKISYDLYTPTGNDYYGLPGLVTLLSRKSKLDLVMEIMDYPLAKRVPFRD
jgi:hypothetical protein